MIKFIFIKYLLIIFVFNVMLFFYSLVTAILFLSYKSKLINIHPSLSHHESIIFQDKLYLFGGNYSSGAYQVTPTQLDLTDSFELPPQHWEALSGDLSKIKLPGITGHRIALDETFKRLYLVGGRTFNLNSRSQTLKSEKIQFWVYDFTTDIWEDLSLKKPETLPSARYFHSLTFYQGKLFLFGGRSLDDSETLGDFYVYSTETGLWNQITFSDLGNCPSSRSEHSAIVVSGNRIAILGGKGKEDLRDIDTIFFISTEDYHCTKRKTKLENVPSNIYSFTSTSKNKFHLYYY